ncbi:2-succinylbenzoate-- chloroplastic peroxisomal [Chlorella sorokiniana]|uniref:2-succinylbenzoate--chloroplastic peroxisomal n=1 Tax=Chlorella sorokiniana TaxID=3076 RepID=A0A2P6TU90_CHLSO|nr:2-succinylbenzoate-- chloroplastic peroxisomal [Chlorella sorokiniana]|eukprot:PRW57638.1 2-succinylbenzoate-- chloroplastic peroxisomal [Chlorella sorokiniana]
MAHIAGYLHAAAGAAATAADAGASNATANHDAATEPPMFLCEGRAATARQASARVSALAAALVQRLDMQPGDRVCVAALATDRHLEALLAITAATGIAAPLNWRWGAAEAAGAAALVGARLLVADAACLRFALAAAGAANGALSTLLLLGSPGEYQQADLAAAPPGLQLAFAEALGGSCPGGGGLVLRAAPGGAALIVYTSGTTGKPKGVTLSHAALHSQCMAKLLMCGYCADDVYLHAAPLFHIGGLCSALAMLAAGARHVFLPRFDGPALLDAIRQHSVTSFIAVPTMVAELLAAASSAGVATLPSVQRILVGGGGMSPALQSGLAALCPAATVHTAYGMTECASSLTFATLWGPGGAGLTNSAGSGSGGAGGSQPAGPAGGVFVGKPPPGIELAIYLPPAGDAAEAGSGGGSGSGGGGGRVLLAGEGEVLTRGPHTMLGYWDDDDATAAAQLPGGWLRTGDLGCLSQGRLWLLGRAKDMIKSGGENVHAWEVERCLVDHPAVSMAAVVGAADWRLGEAVAAAVVLRPGWRWCGARCQVLLAPHGQAAGRAAASSVLAAAAAAVAPAGGRGGSMAGGGLGSSLTSGEQPAPERRQAAGLEEDWRRTLLQRSASRPGSSLERGSSLDDGFLAAEAVCCEQQEPQRHPGALQQLAAVAAGLQAVADKSSSGGGGHLGSSSGRSGSGSEGADERCVDGTLLQQHCRAAGLAGFKLPRVFLLCDAAGAMSTGASSLSSGREVLPLNSTGKVVKHVLRERVQQHMQAAGRAGTSGGDGGNGGSGGTGPRSRL